MQDQGRMGIVGIVMDLARGCDGRFGFNPSA